MTPCPPHMLEPTLCQADGQLWLERSWRNQECRTWRSIYNILL